MACESESGGRDACLFFSMLAWSWYLQFSSSLARRTKQELVSIMVVCEPPGFLFLESMQNRVPS